MVSIGLVGLMIAGAIAMVAAILVIALAVAGAAQRAAAEKIAASEGVVLRSGKTVIKSAYENYVSPTMRASWKRSIAGGELLLTPESLNVITARGFRFTNDDLTKVSAKVEDGHIVLETDQPPSATGKVRIEARVSDAQGWLEALRRRGARA